MDMNEIYIEKYVGEKEYSKFEDRWKFCRKAHGFGFNPFAFLFGLLLFPVVSAADYIFGDKRNAV